MKATVITTGPGVSMATATASRNSWSVSHRYSCTTPPYRKGTMARPLPKPKAPALVKNQRIWPRTPRGAGAARPGGRSGGGHPGGLDEGPAERGEAARRSGPREQPARWSLHEQDDYAAQDEEAPDLVLRPRGHQGHEAGGGPQQGIAAHGEPHELPRRADDDADHRRADAVERGLHPAEASVA